MAWWISRKRLCPDCLGKKVVKDNGNGEKPCERCDGKGWIIPPSML
jgi:DnaJ-class molecular chaperone